VLLSDQFDELLFRRQAHVLCGALALFEDHDGRDATNAVLAGGGRRVIDVELADAGFAVKFIGKLLDDGRKGFARPTPSSRKVDDHGHIRFEDFLIEVIVIEHAHLVRSHIHCLVSELGVRRAPDSANITRPIARATPCIGARTAEGAGAPAAHEMRVPRFRSGRIAAPTENRVYRIAAAGRCQSTPQLPDCVVAPSTWICLIGRVRRESDGVVSLSAHRDGDPWTRGWSAEGLISVLEPLVVERRRARILDVIDGRTDNVTVAMDAPHDPHNGAAVMRTCDAFGIQTLHVVEAIESFLFVRKVSLGTERWVDVERHSSYEAATACLKQLGFTLVAACADGTLVPDDLGRIERLALIVGNERDGVSEAFLDAAMHRVKIPMRGFVESLNLSVATAILLHAAMAQRAGDLSESRRRELYARGLIRSVVRVRDVLSNSSPR
jgi:tRNA (guanosine-2'-O-)-methyltransferase